MRKSQTEETPSRIPAVGDQIVFEARNRKYTTAIISRVSYDQWNVIDRIEILYTTWWSTKKLWIPVGWGINYLFPKSN